ncbi:ABC transporter substrate-binding protein [Limnothrix sp. FACHB-1083]|uniref:ABC transporter ATP-binding/substrate-binding protein n=1 Tax=unclassified Limnothrix TaxID=2632864 RepID=UPI00167FFA22|nr:MULTISPECIES: nitrate ABC transporter ATP-binding protein [unclassified Limnothrix]MBD2160361.1 ABC transporter substrate-binding protein [Limnothrix sp. FACHB-1083]MBD2191062.1 ABC transporter substrate-binding protein [Limnothrix sp. FACHB-1088]
MSAFVAIENLEKVFPLNQGEYLALKGIDLTIKKGEFVSLIGHSGCGKSTLLNMISGLDFPTDGLVTLEGQRIKKPGPDRMVVFQNYSLLPWLTARENIALAVDEVMGDLPKADRDAMVQTHIDMVGLKQAAEKRPGQLSGGMKQRVAIARALALKPKLLLLDEPFGALDALTRGNLQEKLMQICEENQVTAVMVTHDVDEAVLLSDRIVMLTNGPGSKIGQILEVDIPRPRKRMEVVEHPSYYKLRSEMIYFLNQQKRVKKIRARKVEVVAKHGLEKVNLEIGFVPLTACAPLAVAKEKGFFEKYGLDEVNLVRETSWRGIVDGIAGGYIDAAQMPSGMPIWLTVGGHEDRPLPTVTSLTMSRNGNAVTLSKKLFDAGVQTAADFKKLLRETPGKSHILGMVHPSSMHNLLLRYWLAANEIDPDHDVHLETIPPAQMVVDLKAGSIDGYCVGSPWNLRAAMEGVGVTIATDLEIWQGHPGKVLGVREDWANAYPNTHVALVKALLDACRYCSDPANHLEVRKILSDRAYVGTREEYIHLGDPKELTCDLGNPIEYAHHWFYGEGANRPSRTEHLWMMAQMARWGDVPFPRNWLEVLERVVRPTTYSIAARELGLLDEKFRRGAIELFDGSAFDAEDPISYLNSLAIKANISIAEVHLDPPRILAA